MACKFPAAFLKGFRYLFCIFHFFIEIEIRIIFQKFFLIILKVFSCFIRAVRPVSKHTVIAGHRKDSFSSSVGEIRVLFHKTVQKRNHIIISHGNATIVFLIFAFYIPVFIKNHSAGKAVSVHIVIIAHIVLRKNKSFFSGRKHDLSPGHGSILIHFCHIMRTYKDVSFIIHALYDFIKLTDSCHHLIVARLIRIPVKSF